MAVDIGCEAIDRPGSFTDSYMLINKAKPAEIPGTITSIDIWAAVSIGGLRVGTFYTINGDTLKCRDSEAIPGTITAGSKVTKPVSIAVEIGDYIGCYYTSGGIETSHSGYPSLWSKSGEYIDPGDEATYDIYSDWAISLGGYIGMPLIELVGLSAGVCSVSGFTSITRTLAGLSAGVASTAGDLTVRGIKYLAGVASGIASVSGFTSIARSLAGVSSGVASITADLTNLKWLAGAVAGVSSVIGSLGIVKYLAGLSAGVASTAGDLTIRGIKYLAGLSQGIASVSATLGVWKLLAGVIAGVATVTGNLFHVRRAIRVLGAVRNLLSEQNIPPVR